MPRKSSPRKRQLQTDNIERANRIKDAIDKLDRVNAKNAPKIQKEIAEYIERFSNSYALNYGDSMQGSRKRTPELEAVSKNAYKLSAALRALSHDSLHDVALEMWKLDNSFIMMSFFNKSGYSKPATFHKCDFYDYLEKLNDAAKNSLKKVKRNPKDKYIRTLLEYCFVIFSQHSSTRPKRYGAFAQFVEDIWSAVFQYDKDCDEKHGCSGALKAYFSELPK